MAPLAKRTDGSTGCTWCCSVLQCVAVCCSVLQCVAVCCSALQTAPRGVLSVAVCCSVLQCLAVCCSVLQTATRGVHGVAVCSGVPESLVTTIRSLSAGQQAKSCGCAQPIPRKGTRGFGSSLCRAAINPHRKPLVLSEHSYTPILRSRRGRICTRTDRVRLPAGSAPCCTAVPTRPLDCRAWAPMPFFLHRSRFVLAWLHSARVPR